MADLNCDMGESFSLYHMGNDANLMPYIDQANVACGFHASDPNHMRATVELAVRHDVRIGAHVAPPDLAGFGRREMKIEEEEMLNIILYQIGALDAFCKQAGTRLSHIKPHGALYHTAARSAELAALLGAVVAETAPGARLVGPPGSALASAAAGAGIAFTGEGFADRAYGDDGDLVARTAPGAIVSDPGAAARQAVQLACEGKVETRSGQTLALRIQTLCLHGDTPGAVARARAVRTALEAAGIALRAP